MIIAGIHAHVFGQTPGSSRIFLGEPTVDVAVQVPATSGTLIPTSHRIVIEPDALAFNTDHALLNDVAKNRSDRVVVVVAQYEVNFSALNPLTIFPSLIDLAPAKITEDPKRIVWLYDGVDGIE